MNEEGRAIAKQGEKVNKILIGVSLAAFAIMKIIELSARSGTMTYERLDNLIAISTAVVWSFRIISIAVLVYTVLTFQKMNKANIDGGGLMLASAIAMTTLAMFGIVIGILSWILSGMSIKKIKESKESLKLQEMVKNKEETNVVKEEANVVEKETNVVEEEVNVVEEEVSVLEEANVEQVESEVTDENNPGQ